MIIWLESASNFTQAQVNEVINGCLGARFGAYINEPQRMLVNIRSFPLRFAIRNAQNVSWIYDWGIQEGYAALEPSSDLQEPKSDVEPEV